MNPVIFICFNAFVMTVLVFVIAGAADTQLKREGIDKN